MSETKKQKTKQNRIKILLREFAEEVAKTQRGAMAYEDPRTGSRIFDAMKKLGERLPTNKRLEKLDKKITRETMNQKLSLAETRIIAELEKITGATLPKTMKDQIRDLGDNIVSGIAEGRGNVDAVQHALGKTEGLDFGVGARPSREEMVIPKSQQEIREEKEFRKRIEEQGGLPPFREGDDRNPAEINAGVSDQRPHVGDGGPLPIDPRETRNPADVEQGIPDTRPTQGPPAQPVFGVSPPEGASSQQGEPTNGGSDMRNPADRQQGIPDTRPQSGGRQSIDPDETRNPADRQQGIPDSRPPRTGEPGQSVSAPTGGGNDTDTASAPAGDASVATEVPAPQGFISDEEAERMGALIEAPLDRDEEVALKKPEDLTEAEIRRIARRGAYGTPGHRDFTRLNDLVKAWHETHYSTEPLKFDATGRMIRPDLVKQPSDASERPDKNPKRRSVPPILCTPTPRNNQLIANFLDKVS